VETRSLGWAIRLDVRFVIQYDGASLLDNGVPCWIGEIEDQILGPVINRSSKHFGP
jgi:hypothetical protein